LLGEFPKNRHKYKLRRDWSENIYLREIAHCARKSGNKLLSLFTRATELKSNDDILQTSSRWFGLTCSLIFSISIKFMENLRVHWEQNWIVCASVGWPTAVETPSTHCNLLWVLNFQLIKILHTVWLKWQDGLYTVKGCTGLHIDLLVFSSPSLPLRFYLVDEKKWVEGLSFINEVHKNAFNWCEKREVSTTFYGAMLSF